MAGLLWAYWFKLINMHTLSPFISLFTLKSPHWNLQCFSVLRLLAGISQLAASVFYLGWKWDWTLQMLVNGTWGDIWCPAEWISWPPHPHHWEVFFLLVLKLAVYIAHFRTSNISVFVKHLPQGSTAPYCAPTKNNTGWLFLNVSSIWESYFQHGRRNQLWLRYQNLSVIRECDSAVFFYFLLYDSGAAHCSDDTVSHNRELLWGGWVQAFI